MSAKSQVYMWAVILITLGCSLIAYKNISMNIPLLPGKQADVWVVEALIEFDAKKNKAVKASLSLPGYFGHFEVLAENSASEGFGFASIGEGNKRQAIWSKRQADGPQKIYYSFTIFDIETMRILAQITLHMKCQCFLSRIKLQLKK